MTDAPPTASTPVPVPARDRSLDLSLRLLTAIVLMALVGSVGFLVFRIVVPDVYPDTGATARTVRPAPPKPAAGPPQRASDADQVLMAPGRVFRCEDQGGVSFSDRACPAEPDAAPAAPAAARPASP